MNNEKYLRDLILKTIKAYEKYKDIIKDKKTTTKETEANIVGIIFGLKKAYNLKLDELIKKEIDEKKDLYIQQQDTFECGIIEGLHIYRRIMEHNKQYHDNVNLLINYTEKYF